MRTVIIGTVCVVAVFAALVAVLNRLLGHGPFNMDPVNADESLNQVPGGFEDHLKRYQGLAQLVITLATATVAFLVNFLTTGNHDTKYGAKLEAACPLAILLLGFSVVFAFAFILSENLAYETYCQRAQRNTYSTRWYALNVSFGYSSILCFFLAYASLALRILI